jgi:hypothetical protein
MIYYPIVLFCYNRKDVLIQTLNSLFCCDGIKNHDLYIFSDDGKNEISDVVKVLGVRNILNENMKGYFQYKFKSITIIERPCNFGLANNIIYGVSEILEKNEACIVLEDDLLFDKNFIVWINERLNECKHHKYIMSVSGYSYINIIDHDKYYMFSRTNSLGWGTWVDRWNLVDWNVEDFDTFIKDKNEIKEFHRGGKDLTVMLLKWKLGKIQSWGIRFAYACCKYRLSHLYPSKPLVKHIGCTDDATNVKKERKKYPVDCIQYNFANVLRRVHTPSLVRMVINSFKIWKYRNFTIKKNKIKNNYQALYESPRANNPNKK